MVVNVKESPFSLSTPGVREGEDLFQRRIVVHCQVSLVWWSFLSG